MILILNYLVLLFAHWIGDFVFQTDWQAKNKSTNYIALTRHVLSYSAVLLFVSVILFGITLPTLYFVCVNAVLHWFTDYYTSRLNTYLWKQGDTHNFFVSVGFDQYIHQLTLAITMMVFFT